MRQRQRQARRADAAGVADSPINFGGKLSAATHTLATVVECSERAYGCTGRGRGVDEVAGGICEASARAPAIA